jgi:hypothetical protein
VIVSGPLDRIAPERWDHTREAMLDNADQSDLLAEHESQANSNVWALDV